MAKTGTVIWNELNTWDVEKAKAFYAGTLGWTYQTEKMPNDMDGEKEYVLCLADGVPVAGIFALTSPDFDGAGDMWIPYFSVADVDAAAGEVVSAGGKLLRPVFDVPGTGRIAILLDNTGSCMGFMAQEPMD